MHRSKGQTPAEVHVAKPRHDGSAAAAARGSKVGAGGWRQASGTVVLWYGSCLTARHFPRLLEPERGSSRPLQRATPVGWLRPNAPGSPTLANGTCSQIETIRRVPAPAVTSMGKPLTRAAQGERQDQHTTRKTTHCSARSAERQWGRRRAAGRSAVGAPALGMPGSQQLCRGLADPLGARGIAAAAAALIACYNKSSTFPCC